MRARASLLVASLWLAAPHPSWAQTNANPFGDEGVATVDGARGLEFNPAALGLRYPGELLLAFGESGPRQRTWGGIGTAGGFGIGYSGAESGESAIRLGLGSGGRLAMIGASLAWLDGQGSNCSDVTLGWLSRPQPWLSLGALGEHLFEPRFEGELLGRDYTLALGVRPLAFSRAGAFALGPRLALSADVSMAENAPASAARTRVGGELELIPGLSLHGSVTRDGFRAGLELLAPRSGYRGLATFDPDGVRRSTAHGFSFHAAEDRTKLATRPSLRVARIKASGELADESMPGVSIFGGGPGQPAALLHRQLERALEDPLTRGVLLELDQVTGMAQIEELRVRIARLRAAGKPVVAYLEQGGGRGDLYLASACDRIVATEEAAFAALGLRAERRSYRPLLASWGVRLDRASVGPYKSAFRNFSQDSTPPEDKEQIEHQLDISQRLFVETVSQDRHMDRERLMGLLDGRWWPAAEARKAGLIDSVGYRDDALALLGRLSGLSAKPHQVSLLEAVPSRRAWMVPRPVAVVYASGGIEDGHDGSDLLNGPYMGSSSVASRLEKAFRDPETKAVVLRVESPGGSGLGSNLILHAAARLKRETKKPLIVSMGGVAASGGYYISMAGDRLYADRYTRTGSIGVLFVKPSLQGWYQRHDVKQEVFERGADMGAWSLGRNWTPRWQASADSAVRVAYEIFKGRVAQGRGLSMDQVEAVAGGRVWFGEEAMEHQLVDAVGGLEDAVAEARRRAKVPAKERIDLAEYRRRRPWLFERLADRAVQGAVASMTDRVLARMGELASPETGFIELRADDLDFGE